MAGQIPSCATVTVTYYPDVVVLGRQLAALGTSAAVVVVDNATTGATAERLQELLVAHPRATLVANARNLGLAAALNRGAWAALERCPDCAYLLFLDQDTEPGTGGVEDLVRAAHQISATDGLAGPFGPLMVDSATGVSHGVHVLRGWRWRRVMPAPRERAPLRCASVNGSGMLVPVALYRLLGGFDEELFIDHVDTEYSFRAARAGRHLYTVPGVRFLHRMGQRSIRIWLGGWRIWPYRGPLRHYYLFRNSVLLMRRPSAPRVWKAWAVAKLALTALVHAVADPARGAQLRAMAAGLRAGLRGETGEAGAANHAA